jgi:predicted nucleic acid-binding protein
VSDRHPPRAVLDADILYSRVLHELFGRLAAQLRLLDLFWSEQLLAETQRSLIEHKRLPAHAARRWVDYRRQSFPTGPIDIEQPELPDLASLTRDPGDHHICALALAAKADYLFTHNRGYLRDGLKRYGVHVAAPDDFLTAAFDADPRGLLERLESQASAWTGGRPIEQLIDAIDRAGAPAFAAMVRAHL